MDTIIQISVHPLPLGIPNLSIDVMLNLLFWGGILATLIVGNLRKERG